MTPQPVLIVSAEGDQYANDAPEVIARARPNDLVSHFREKGGHALTQARFDHIVGYVSIFASDR